MNLRRETFLLALVFPLSNVRGFLNESSRKTARRTPTALCWGLFRRRKAKAVTVAAEDDTTTATTEQLFQDFVDFLLEQQKSIVEEIENTVERTSGRTFSRDVWGIFDEEEEPHQGSSSLTSGGITRVLQGGDVIEKGACSLTLIQDGVLTAERAANIRARQQEEGGGINKVQTGDEYSAAAVSMVLHSRSPWVPTFRSDVRVFLVRSATSSGESWAWFGGGADLTPYYLFEDDISFFHQQYRDLCLTAELPKNENFPYETMKKACDDYFYLPARKEHRGTGGIFFDDMPMTMSTLQFVKGVTNRWMPSWLPIATERSKMPFTKQQKHWQLLRRGRYLEFNLLYDVSFWESRVMVKEGIQGELTHPVLCFLQRGVKFGLLTPNPRVEGVMVSAPPVIAYEYKHEVEPGSPEEDLVKVLKTPRDWV
jgi:coproporphyrinogen III oxidase